MELFDRNLILQAGAGTGKTHALVTLALQVLAGANARRAPVPPNRLVALTFTDKAGAELRERLQQRLAPLTEGIVPDDLASTLRSIDLPAPKLDHWRRVRRDLALATVGTFHSFCATQLRRLAGPAGLDPGFAVLDEADATDLFHTASEEYVLRSLARGDTQAQQLVRTYGLSNDHGSGTINLIRSVLARLSEEGRSPDTLDDGRFADALALTNFQRAADELRRAVSGLDRLENKDRTKLAPAINALRDTLATLNAEHALETISKLGAIKMDKPRGDAGFPVLEYRESLEALRTAAAGLSTAPLGRAIVALAAAVERRYAEVKRDRGVLDFSDLQRLLRDLLRRNTAARHLVKSRFDALFVDEMQDTSRIQLDLIALLAESRSGEADLREVENIPAAVQYEPGLLCIVGDRKQSIYEFRGADVAVFSQASAALQRTARTEVLRHSYRSRPELVELSNTLFQSALSAANAPFEVAFTPDDALDPVFKESATGPLAELIESHGEFAEEQRTDEASRMAVRIDSFVHGAIQVRTKDAWRPSEGRDIALLFRRMTNLEVYRDALAARNIAHVVVGGSGFYGTREVLDAWALLRVLDDPDDIVASAAVLRSPWCSLRDDTIIQLSLSGDKFAGISIARLLHHRPTLADPDEQARLTSLLDFIEPAHRELDRMGAAAALSHAIVSLDYLAISADDAIAANLEKLRRLLERWQQTVATPRAVVRLLTECVRERPREPEAPSSEESDPRSVRLMTIHQAKGLEFPIVFVVDCGATDGPDTSAVAFDRDLGLALAVRHDDDDQFIPGPGLKDVRARLRARSQAELLRLFYVAVTRARDYVVFSGAPRKGSWFELVAALPPTLLRRVDVDSAQPNLSAVSPGHATTAESPPLDSLPVQRVFTTVTRLRDYADCPERYRLKHEIGLEEPHGSLERHGTAPNAALLGSLAHRLLEIADFQPLDDNALDELLRAEAADPRRPEIAQMRAAVRDFLNGPVAREFRAAKRRLREMPFQLGFDLSDGRHLELRGQIDVLAFTTEAAQVLDYKLSPAESAEPGRYRFQLATYGLAVREIIAGAPLPIDVGLVPLKTPIEEVAWTRLDPADIDAHADQIQALGKSLIEALSQSRWPKQPVETCRALHCGFLSRCHSSRHDR